MSIIQKFRSYDKNQKKISVIVLILMIVNVIIFFTGIYIALLITQKL